MLLELVLLIVQVVCNLLAQEVVVEGPEPPVAALNMNVTYTCRANGSVIWAINDRQVQFDEAFRTSLMDMGIYVPSTQELVTVARIDPTQVVNGTSIQCQWLGREITDGILGRSRLINFTTYGIPSSPSDLVIQVDVPLGGYTLSWTSGFQFSTENVTFSITANTGSMSQGYYATDPSVFIPTPASGTTCTQYDITIVAENAVGASDTSLQITVPAPTAPKLLEADAVETSVSLVNSMASFHITFKDPSPCSEFAVQHYNLMLFEVANSINGSLSSPIVSMPSFTISADTGMMITISVNGSNSVLVNREYIVTLTATNNVSSSQLNLSISTAGLQAAHILVNSDMSTLTVTCTFAEGSGALGCVALLSDDMLVRANVSDGNLVAMNTALWPPGAQVDNVVVVEVLQSGDISAIRTRPSIATIPTTPSYMSTEEIPIESSVNPFSVTTSDTGSILGGSTLLYIIIGAIVAVILVLICIIVIVLIIIRHGHKKRKVIMFNSGEELRTNYVYGGRESTPHIYGTDEFANLEMGKLARNNTYDTADSHLGGPSNGKLSVPIPTYATVETARKDALLAGGPAVLNPVYGPSGCSLSPATSPTPTPTPTLASASASISKQASNPIYSEAYATIPGKSVPREEMKQVSVSGLNPVYGGLGSVPSSLHSQSDASPCYANSPKVSRPPNNQVDQVPASPGNCNSPPSLPLYEELKPVKLLPAPGQVKETVPTLTSNESYGKLNGNQSDQM